MKSFVLFLKSSKFWSLSLIHEQNWIKSCENFFVVNKIMKVKWWQKYKWNAKYLFINDASFKSILDKGYLQTKLLSIVIKRRKSWNCFDCKFFVVYIAKYHIDLLTNRRRKTPSPCLLTTSFMHVPLIYSVFDAVQVLVIKTRFCKNLTATEVKELRICLFFSFLKNFSFLSRL